MKDDTPTVPKLYPHDSREPDLRERVRADVPTWPALAPVARRSLSGENLRFIALGASLAFNALLCVTLLGLLVVLRTSLFAAPASYAPAPLAGTASKTALGSPTTTASPASGTGSLRVAPASVRLGCDSGQQTQFAVLMNSGSANVEWQINLTPSGDGDQAPISVRPSEGTIRPGTSIVVQLQNRSQTGVAQGTVQFVPTSADSDVGSAAVVSYTAMGCSN